MKIATRSGVVALAIVAAFAAAGAGAATQYYINDANAPGRCQAYTPGPTNTVRNRVTGSENIGAAMNIACAFESVSSEDYGSNVTQAGVQIVNNGSTAIAVTCSELGGYFDDAGVVLSKTTPSIAPGDAAYVDYTANDTPDSGDTDLGWYLVGIVCNLPTHAVMGETYAIWRDEDGV